MQSKSERSHFSWEYTWLIPGNKITKVLFCRKVKSNPTVRVNRINIKNSIQIKT